MTTNPSPTCTAEACRHKSSGRSRVLCRAACAIKSHTILTSDACGAGPSPKSDENTNPWSVRSSVANGVASVTSTISNGQFGRNSEKSPAFQPSPDKRTGATRPRSIKFCCFIPVSFMGFDNRLSVQPSSAKLHEKYHASNAIDPVSEIRV